MAIDQTTATDSAPPPPPERRSNWTGGRVVGVVFSSLGALIGAALLIGGLVVIGAYAFARDDGGFFSSSTKHLQRPAYAITTGNIDLGADPADWAPNDLRGTVRVTAEGATERPIFLGIGPTGDVNRYLGGVGRAELTDYIDGRPRFDMHPGGPPAGPPGAQHFWAAASHGSGQQRLDWDARAGQWSVAVMNADAARGVSVDADVGIKIDWLIWVGVGLALVGLAVLGGGVALIVIIARRARPRSAFDGAP